jgi:hypothetical protein
MPKFVRVKDTTTKHQFDVPENDWRIAAGHLELIKADRYPSVDRPRRAKHHIPRKTAEPVEPTEGASNG